MVLFNYTPPNQSYIPITAPVAARRAMPCKQDQWRVTPPHEKMLLYHRLLCLHHSMFENCVKNKCHAARNVGRKSVSLSRRKMQQTAQPCQRYAMNAELQRKFAFLRVVNATLFQHLMLALFGEEARVQLLA